MRPDEIPTVDQMVASKFLSAAGLSGPTETVTITRIRRTQETFDAGKKETVNVFSLRREDGTEAEVVFCRTNVFACRVLFGEEPRAWVGKTLVLRADLDLFGGAEVDCIRVEGSPDAKPKRAAVYREAFDHPEGRSNRKLIRRLKAIVAKTKRLGFGPRVEAPAQVARSEDTEAPRPRLSAIVDPEGPEEVDEDQAEGGRDETGF